MNKPMFAAAKGQYERWVISGVGDMMLSLIHISNATEIAVAVFTEGFHVEGVVITEIPLVLLGEKDQRATNLPVR